MDCRLYTMDGVEFRCERCGRTFHSRRVLDPADLHLHCSAGDPSPRLSRVSDPPPRASTRFLASPRPPAGGCCGGGGAIEHKVLSYPSRPPIAASGLISPADQWAIQIEITNHCSASPGCVCGKCSNCSRFVPHVAPGRRFFMDQETFRRAVDSMAGYPGLLGVMGGNPPDHPEFETLARYYDAHWHPQHASHAARRPIRDFGEHHAAHLAHAHGKRRGLWSSLGSGYYQHYETIQEVWGDGYQCLNDHHNGARHNPLLVRRADLGIPDAVFFPLRDRCRYQRLWSSSINPRGAWFCEIAAALAMLFGGHRDFPSPEGWPIEPEWWRRTPAEFGGQTAWCEYCGGALELPGRLATEMIQDASAWYLERLREIDSPAIAAGRYAVQSEEIGEQRVQLHANDSDWYMPVEDKRRRARGAGLRPRRIEAVSVCVDYGDFLRRTLPSKIRQFDRYVVVTASHDELTQRVAKDCGAQLVVSDACYLHGDALNKARMLNEGLKALDLDDWLCFTDPDIFLPADFGSRLGDLVLNPGCLYYSRRNQLPPGCELPDWSQAGGYEFGDPPTNHSPWGYLQLVNVRARALAGHDLRRLFPAVFCSAASVDHWLQARWEPSKRVSLYDFDSGFLTVHIPHGRLGERWNGVRGARGGWEYAGQSNFGSEQSQALHWQAPCLARRVDMATAEIHDTIRWLGRAAGDNSPVWPTRAEPGAIYEYAIRRLTEEQSPC
jgi:hypothetical protein